MRAFALILLMAPLFGAQLEARALGHKRALGIEDILALEQVRGGTVSPSGEMAAFVIQRSRLDTQAHTVEFDVEKRCDIWLWSRESPGELKRLTDGRADGTEAWLPMWSPDGETLAFLSTRGGGIKAWVWERSTGRMSQVLAEKESISFSGMTPAIAWLNRQVLLFAALPPGESPEVRSFNYPVAPDLDKYWAEMRKGSAPTVSVISSGVPGPPPPGGHLVSYDAYSRTSRDIAVGRFAELNVAPDGRSFAAIERVGPLDFETEWNIEIFPAEKHRLAVFGADGPWSMSSLSDQERAAVPGTVRWSPDSTSLAWVSPTIPGKLSSSQLVAIRGHDAQKLDLHNGALQPSIGWYRRPLKMGWLSSGTLLAWVEKGTGNEAGWWLFSPTRSPAHVGKPVDSAADATLPDAWVPSDGTSLLGISPEGNIWRLTEGAGASIVQALPRDRTYSLRWPNVQPPAGGGMPSSNGGENLLFSSQQGDRVQEQWLWSKRSGLRRIPTSMTVGSAVKVLDYAVGKDVTLLEEQSPHGSRLLVGSPELQQAIVVRELNRHFAEVAPAKVRDFSYKSLAGEALKGRLILPSTAREGVRLPLIVWQYPGSVLKAKSRIRNVDEYWPLSPELLAAAGYAVLQPSMPLASVGDVRQPYDKLTNGVLPAIDEAVRLGVGDPDRVGLIGHSFGGYGVYGLITQTKRFRAAIALAGSSDLVSLYSSSSAAYRYGNFRGGATGMMQLLEFGQVGLGGPPWSATAGYRANSPIAYVDKVSTPLLIIHGDLDYVPIEQGEGFFISLLRQNKRADFARYWGEGHVIDSPANLRDAWRRICTWFDDYLDVERDGSGEMVIKTNGKNVNQSNGSDLSIARR